MEGALRGMMKSSPTWPDLGVSGYLVVVRLVAGVLISDVHFSGLGMPFWGWTENKLASFYVNVNDEFGIFRPECDIPNRLIVKRFEQAAGHRSGCFIINCHSLAQSL